MFGLPSYAVDTDVSVAFGLSIGPPVGAMLPVLKSTQKALTNISVTLESRGLGSYSLDFDAWDGKLNDTSLLTHTQLAVGNRATLTLGTGTHSAALISGPITDLAASFSASGISLSVSGYDVRHVLRQGLFLRVFSEQNELEIAEAICKARGISVSVEKGTTLAPPPLKVMRQAGQESDFEFINSLLDRVGFVLDVEGEKAIIRPPAVKPLNPFLINSYTPTTLTNFSATDSILEQIDGVIVIGRDPETGKKIEGTAGTVKSLLAPVSVITLHRDVDTQAAADRIAQSELDRRLTKKLTASAALRGDATLIPGAWVDIADVGPFSGSYRINRAVHAWSPNAGYTTTLTLEQEA